MKTYRSCAVPMCKNSTTKCPDKLFVLVPKSHKRKWLEEAHINPDFTAHKRPIYFCEDHFDLPNDMENYMEYCWNMSASVSRMKMKMKLDCLPTKFDCQTEKKEVTPPVLKPQFVYKGPRKEVKQEIDCMKTGIPTPLEMTSNTENNTKMNPQENEAPLLENFFREMIRASALNYCVVCLRTEKERTLMVSRSLKKFATAVQIENKWQNHRTCYICERQAANALKFFKAAAFASAINNMFENLMFMRYKGYVKSKFVKALKKISKDTDLSHPCDWEDQLRQIRRRTDMSETEPLVIDNRGVKLKPVITNEVFIIPDDPSMLGEVSDCGAVTSTATRSCGTTHISDADGRVAGQRRGSDRTDPGNGLTGDHEVIMLQSNDSFELSSSEPRVSETFVILEDDEEKDPLQIRIESVKSEADQPTHPQPPSDPNSPPKPDDPKTPQLNMVPIERLLEKPKKTDDPVVIVKNTPENFIFHPIILNGGLLTVPSLSATIVDGVLTIQPPVIPNQNSIVESQGPVTQISESVQCQNLVPDTDVSSKRESDFGFTTPSKKVKGLPVIQSVTSEAVKNDRIDWEDKIPMDVISFVHPGERALGRPPATPPAPHVLVLPPAAPHVLLLPPAAPALNDVIDLC